MSGVAGRKALVKITGDAVAFVNEACTDSGDHLTYQITNAAKQVWDPTVAIVVKKDGVAASSALYTLNRLTGRVTFLVALNPAIVITVSGSYLPTSVAAGCRQYSWSLTQAVIDDTDFDSANTNSGFTDSLRALFSFEGSLGRRWRMETYFEDSLLDSILVVVEFYPDRTAAFELRAWALLNKSDLSMVLDGAIDGNVGFVGATDADGRVASLSTQ